MVHPNLKSMAWYPKSKTPDLLLGLTGLQRYDDDDLCSFSFLFQRSQKHHRSYFLCKKFTVILINKVVITICDNNLEQLSFIKCKFFVDGVSVWWHRRRIVVEQSDEYPIGRHVNRLARTVTARRSLMTVPMPARRPVATTAILVAVPEQWVLDGIGVRRALVLCAAVVSPSSAAVPVASATVIRSTGSSVTVNRRRAVLSYPVLQTTMNSF